MGGGAAPADGPDQTATEAAPAAAAPDQVWLTDGTLIRGHVASETADGYEVFVEVESGAFVRSVLPAERVDRVVRAAPDARQAMREKIAWWRTKQGREAGARAQYTVERVEDWFGFGEAWRCQGSYFAVLTDLAPHVARDFAWKLDLIYPHWCRAFGVEPDAAEPTPVHLFTDEQQYERILRTEGGETHIRPPLPSGLYNSTTKAVYMIISYGFRGTQRREAYPVAMNHRNLNVAYHEGFHAFEDRCIQRGSVWELPRWVSEGLAMHYAMATIDYDGLHVGDVDPQILARLRREIRDGQAKSLTEALEKGWGYGFYPYNWSLVYYLDSRGLVRADQGEWARFMGKAGQSSVEEFEAVVGKPIAEFELEWREFFLRLPE